MSSYDRLVQLRGADSFGASVAELRDRSGGGVRRRSAELLRTAAMPPSMQGARRGFLRGLASAAVAVGLFTVSWERLGNVALGPYNLKIAVVAFALGALAGLPLWISRIRVLAGGGWLNRVLLLLALAIVMFIVVRALFTDPLTGALAQAVAVISGAVLPALAVLGVHRRSEDAAWGLRWFVRGATAASGFGLYQLLAFYTGLPQGIVYTGVGTSGSGGRISAFSYEPAYFAYFLVLALGAVVALARLEARRVRWGALLFFSFVLTLVNVRALLFVLPVVALLLAIDWRSNRVTLGRALIAGAAGALIAVVIPLGATALTNALQPAADPAPSSLDSAGGGGAVEAPDPAAREDRPAAPQLPTDVLDPNEVSSNGPRLDLYRAVLRVDLQHVAVGVGPGGLRSALKDDGYVAPNQGTNVVANNIWLQAAADGGIPLVLLELGVLIVIGVLWWSARRSPEQPLLAALLAVLLVGGMLTSYFFDIKIWVVLALALCVRAAKPAVPTPVE